MTLREIADAVYSTESSISKYESGKADPNIEMMMRLADYFGVDPNYQLGRE